MRLLQETLQTHTGSRSHEKSKFISLCVRGRLTNQISGQAEVSKIPYGQKPVVFQFWVQRLRDLF